jgi:hypothetical protein
MTASVASIWVAARRVNTFSRQRSAPHRSSSRRPRHPTFGGASPAVAPVRPLGPTRSDAAVVHTFCAGAGVAYATTQRLGARGPTPPSAVPARRALVADRSVGRTKDGRMPRGKVCYFTVSRWGAEIVAVRFGFSRRTNSQIETSPANWRAISRRLREQGFTLVECPDGASGTPGMTGQATRHQSATTISRSARQVAQADPLAGRCLAFPEPPAVRRPADRIACGCGDREIHPPPVPDRAILADPSVALGR